MKHNTRLAAIERRHAQRKPPRQVWIYYDGDTEALSCTPQQERRPVSEIPPDALRVVIQYVDV